MGGGLGGFLAYAGSFFAFFRTFFRFLIIHRDFIDFWLILEGFWEGLGMPKWSKNGDFGCFFGYASGDLIFGRICLIFDEIDD